MDEPQIIKSPSGDVHVVLPRQQYDALVNALAEAEEELADIATLDARKAEMATDKATQSPAISLVLPPTRKETPGSTCSPI